VTALHVVSARRQHLLAVDIPDFPPTLQLSTFMHASIDCLQSVWEGDVALPKNLDGAENFSGSGTGAHCQRSARILKYGK
jgi:hypothetical protein